MIRSTAAAGRRLGRRTRRILLIAHHSWRAAPGSGSDVAMAVLIFTAIGTDSPSIRSATLQTLRLVTVWPMFSAALVSLTTGVLLGLGSRFGLIRYWWVAIKLALNLLLATLILIALRGGVAEAAEVGRQLAGGNDPAWGYTDLLYPPIVSPTALTVAFVLSVVKPWGRIRRLRSPAAPDPAVRAVSGQG